MGNGRSKSWSHYLYTLIIILLILSGYVMLSAVQANSGSQLQYKIISDPNSIRVYDTDLSGFMKRRAINIDNPGPALTDYQVLIKVNYDSDMQPDFDDLRFTDSDGVTELSYWIMEKIDSDTAYVWVKIPLIPSLSSKIIYMYYGNPSASSTSNGEETFDFFDDFGADDALNTDKWDEVQTNAIIDWSSNEYVEVSGSGGQDWIIRTKQNNSVDFIAEFKLDIVSFNGSSRKFIFQVYDEGNNVVDYPINWGKYYGGNGPDGDLSTGVRWFKVILKSDGWSVYLRTSLDSSWSPWRSGSWSEDFLKPALRHFTGSPSISGSLTERWYYYFHRKYAAVEPTTSIGIEETYTGVGETEVDEKDTADTKVIITAQEPGFTTITKLSSNPNGPIPSRLIPLKYIRIQTTASISKAVIRIYYTDEEVSTAGIHPKTLRIYHAVQDLYWEPLRTTFGKDADGKYCQAEVTSLSDFSLMGSSVAPVGGETYSEAPLALTWIIIQKNLGFIALVALSVVMVVVLLRRL